MESPVYDPLTGVPVFTIVAGTESPAESDTPCDCCGNKGRNQPPKICTDHATCNDFCTGFAVFDRSECCECPCPGRLAYPKCFIVTGSIAIATEWDSGGSHYEITPGHLNFGPRNPACGGTSQTTIHVKEFIGGTLHGESDFVVQMDSDAVVITDCFPDGDKGKIHVSIGVSIVSGTGTATVPGSSFLGEASQHVGTACKGGTGTIFSNTESIAGFGTFSVTPSCDDCPDVPGSCGILDGESPAVCGDRIDIQFEHDTHTTDGMGNEIWELLSGTLSKSGPCSWGAGIGDGSASIQTATTDPSCCPDCDCNDCDGTCPNTCNTCWALLISAGIDSETIDLGGGSCPPGSTFNGTAFRNIIISSPDGCPPP